MLLSYPVCHQIHINVHIIINAQPANRRWVAVFRGNFPLGPPSTAFCEFPARGPSPVECPTPARLCWQPNPSAPLPSLGHGQGGRTALLCGLLATHRPLWPGTGQRQMLTFSSRPPFILYPKLALPSMKGFEASRTCAGLKWSGTFLTPIGYVGMAGFSDSPAEGNGVKAKEGSATPEKKAASIP